jgi:hypothetical protein
MAHQRIILPIALWLACISHLSTSLYPNDLATTTQTLAKQNETILNILGNDELRNQHDILPYLQDLERNNNTVIAAINSTNPQLIPIITMMLATDINTVAVGLDPLVNDLLAFHTITNPHPVAQQLFKAVIITMVANMVHEVPTPSIDQCRQTSQTIGKALETCATLLKTDLPLLSPGAEKGSTKRRVFTWLWYLTLTAAAVGAGVLFYQYVIKPLQDAHARITALNEQLALAQTVVQQVEQHIKQTDTDVTTIKGRQSLVMNHQQQPIINAPITTADPAVKTPQNAKQPNVATPDATISSAPTPVEVQTNPIGYANQEEFNNDIAIALETITNNVTGVAGRVTTCEHRIGDLDHMVERESTVLTNLTAPPPQPSQELAPSTATQTFNKIFTVAHAAVTNGASTGGSAKKGLPQLAARHQRPIATTSAPIDRTLLQQIETLPAPPS